MSKGNGGSRQFIQIPRPPEEKKQSSKTFLRVGFSLVGIGIVLASTWFLFANFTRSGSAPVSETSVARTPESAVCTNIQHCAANRPGKTPTHGASSRSSPTTRPTVGITYTPNPTLSSTSLSVVPQSLTISRSSVCSIGALTPLTLVNQGSSLLIWSQDTAGTSPGLTITDPGRTYRIPPGQTSSGSIRCRGSLPTGQYKLGIDFNGGVAHIVVVVTA